MASKTPASLPGSPTGQAPPPFATFAYWLSIALILVFLLLNLALALIRGSTSSFVLLGIAVSTLCVILWGGHVTKVCPIAKGTAAAIWATLILSLLATSATLVRRIIAPPELKVNEVIWLNDSYIQRDERGDPFLTRFERKQNSSYQIITGSDGTKDATIPFAFIVSGFQTDDAGNFQVKAEATFFGTDQAADFSPLPKEEKDYLKKMPLIKRLAVEDIVKEVGPLREKALYLTIADHFKPWIMNSGEKSLHLVVTDELSHRSVIFEQPLVMEDRAGQPQHGPPK